MSEGKDPRDDKRVLGMPYDWRKPTAARFKSRVWNPDDPRLFPPRSFGAGWTINAYWLVHSRKRRRAKQHPPRSS